MAYLETQRLELDEHSAIVPLDAAKDEARGLFLGGRRATAVLGQPGLLWAQVNVVRDASPSLSAVPSGQPHASSTPDSSGHASCVGKAAISTSTELELWQGIHPGEEVWHEALLALLERVPLDGALRAGLARLPLPDAASAELSICTLLMRNTCDSESLAGMLSVELHRNKP